MTGKRNNPGNGKRTPANTAGDARQCSFCGADVFGNYSDTGGMHPWCKDEYEERARLDRRSSALPTQQKGFEQ